VKQIDERDKLTSMESDGTSSVVDYELSPSEVGQFVIDNCRALSFPH
jgi:hypothetical protein